MYRGPLNPILSHARGPMSRSYKFSINCTVWCVRRDLRQISLWLFRRNNVCIYCSVRALGRKTYRTNRNEIIIGHRKLAALQVTNTFFKKLTTTLTPPPSPKENSSDLYKWQDPPWLRLGAWIRSHAPVSTRHYTALVTHSLQLYEVHRAVWTTSISARFLCLRRVGFLSQRGGGSLQPFRVWGSVRPSYGYRRCQRRHCGRHLTRADIDCTQLFQAMQEQRQLWR